MGYIQEGAPKIILNITPLIIIASSDQCSTHSTSSYIELIIHFILTAGH